MARTLSKTDVAKLIAALPQLRPSGIPFDSKAGCLLVCDNAQAIRETAAALHDRFAVTPLYTALSLNGDAARSSRIGVRVVPLNALRRRARREIVVMVSDARERTPSLRKTRAVHDRGRTTFFFSANVAPNVQPRGRIFEENAGLVVETVNRLADEESRLCYLSRLKALMFGDPGFIRLSDYRQYQHPVVRAEPGDRVCEGGVGGTATSTLTLARMAGDAGWVVAFEPVRGQFESASARVAGVKNITLEHAGLWSEPGETEIRVAGPVSTMTGGKHLDKPVEPCTLTSIDEYFGGRLHKPTIIKLDIEGAEPHALRGGKAVIDEHRPKLQVCLYHSIEHFLHFPLAYMRKGYRVYIGHHTPFMNECLMYAIAG